MSIEGIEKLKNIFFKDLEQCPFLPKDAGYDRWMERHDLRLKVMSEERTKLANDVSKYFAHPEVTVRTMAHMLDYILEK